MLPKDESFCTSGDRNNSRKCLSKISVKDIATMLSLHENYLSRLFKLDMGISIKEYISEIKLSIANDLLSSTEYSIQQISDKIGFQQCNLFKSL